MSVLDIQASKDFAANWEAWHKQHTGRLTAFATCPLPPAGNRLPVAVEAGEQIPYEAKFGEA
jgi:hypothetical protein